jgi:hypothetical protein
MEKENTPQSRQNVRECAMKDTMVNVLLIASVPVAAFTAQAAKPTPTTAT